jgi:DNA-binding transcriptional regulator LsrR (DeoR family)
MRKRMTRTKAARRAQASQMLTPDEVRWARMRWFTPNESERLTQRQIAERLDVTLFTVGRLLRYETYRGIT